MDVGCNEGWVTCEIGRLNVDFSIKALAHSQLETLAQVWGASKVVGVDIDESLVEAAWRRRRTLWSLQSPTAHNEYAFQPLELGEGSQAADEEPPKKKRKRGKPDAVSKDGPGSEALRAETALKARNHFPASCEHEFGSLPIPPSDLRGKHVFPHNVSFRCADWTNADIIEDAAGYDVVVAFSVSKWIHLNTLDAGLTAFFHKAHRVLRQGGTFVLEPQPWDSYAKARRMSERLKENAKQLQLRPDDFERILEEIGFQHERRIEVGEGGKWNRWWTMAC